MNIKSSTENYTEDYFRSGSKGSSYSEEYWFGSQRIFRWFLDRLRLIEKIITNSRVVLDVGCGACHSSRVLREMSGSALIIALDISIDAMRRARQLYGNDPMSSFIVADAETLPLRENSVDLSIAMSLYEHLECPIRFLSEIGRVSDKVFIVTDNARSIGAILKGERWVGIRDLTHKSLTTPEQLKINLMNSGFARVRIITHGFPILNTIEKLLKRPLRSPLGLGAEIIAIAEKAKNENI